jgi:hypothetical protein
VQYPIQTLNFTIAASPNNEGILGTISVNGPGVLIAPPVVPLVDASTITIDLSLSTKFTLLTTSAVGSARTLAFVNAVVGQVYSLEIVQAASGGPYTITLPGSVLGARPALTTTAGNHDLVTLYCRAPNSFAVALAIANY